MITWQELKSFPSNFFYFGWKRQVIFRVIHEETKLLEKDLSWLAPYLLFQMFYLINDPLTPKLFRGLKCTKV